MKALYELIIERLSLVPEIKWIDKKSNQDDKSLKYPAVLVSFSSQQKDMTENGDQEHAITATVTAIFDATGLRSASAVTAPMFARSLEYERICDDVYKKLQGYSNEVFESLSCRSIVDDNRTDGFLSKTMIFETTCITEVQQE